MTRELLPFIFQLNDKSNKFKTQNHGVIEHQTAFGMRFTDDVQHPVRCVVIDAPKSKNNKNGFYFIQKTHQNENNSHSTKTRRRICHGAYTTRKINGQGYVDGTEAFPFLPCSTQKAWRANKTKQVSMFCH